MCIASAPELRVNQLIYNAIITKFPDKAKLDDFYNVTDADFLEALKRRKPQLAPAMKAKKCFLFAFRTPHACDPARLIN